jgi:lipopolysaccharide transport system permease protein
MKIMGDIYKYRGMLKNQVKMDLRTRYKGSFLGFLWTFANPLLQLLVYTVVFKSILKVEIPNFAIFLFVGLLPWIFFSSSVLGSSINIIANANLIKKIYFPRYILPLSLVIGSLLNYIFGLCILIPTLYFSGIGISWTVLYLPLLLVIQFVFLAGLSLLLSSLNVYFRDLQHIMEVLVMVWFYLTPVFYSKDIAPDYLKKILEINPMANFVDAYREILINKQLIPGELIFKLLVISIVTLLFGAIIFNKLQKGFAEEL